MLFLLRRESTTRNVSGRFLWNAPIRRLRVLKLRVSALRLFTRPETLGFIITRSVSEGFPATLRKPRNAIPRLRVGLGSSQTRNFKTYASGWNFGTGPEYRCGNRRGSIFAAGQSCSAGNRVPGLHLQDMSLHAIEVAGDGRFKNWH